MKKQNIFQFISENLVNNAIHGGNSITFKNNYPQGAIMYAVNKAHAFIVTSYKKTFNESNGKFYYTITYDKFDRKSPLLSEAQQYQIEKSIRKGYISNDLYSEKNYDTSITTKFGNINNDFRQELDCPNVSNEPDEYGYMQCPFNNRSNEHVFREDSCRFELFTQWLGFDNYRDFVLNNDLDDEEIDALYTQFLNDYLAPDWSYKDEEEPELSLV